MVIVLSLGCSYICFATNRLIGQEDQFFTPVKWWAVKILSEMIYTVLSGTLNPTTLCSKKTCDHIFDDKLK